MKLVSWNINGIRAIERKWAIQALFDFWADMIFLQEIKAKSDQLSEQLLHPVGYHAVYHSALKAGYSGVGVWIREELMPHVLSIDHHLPGNPVEDEGRVIHVTYALAPSQKLHIYGIYFPNGGKSEEAWGHKLEFYRALSHASRAHLDAGDMVLWGGDINTAHQPIDLARPKENDGKIGFHPMERSWLDSMKDEGFVDIWRSLHPETPDVYSWWDQVTRARDRNVGWRIDAWWADQSFVQQVHPQASYLSQVMGSDHCPVVVEW
jgi:exodeoxyribonuclease-3